MEDEDSTPVPEAPEEDSGGEEPVADAGPDAVLPYARAGQSAWSATGETCAEPDEQGRATCVEQVPASSIPQEAMTALTARAGVAPPQWCEDSNGKVVGIRTAVCLVGGADFTTKEKVNGTWRETGRAKLLFISYSYGDTGLGTIAHQIEVSAYGGWGDALNEGSVKGSASKGGACKVSSSKFPKKPLMPKNSWRLGESFFDTTIHTAGTKGKCQSTWTLNFQAPAYPDALLPVGFNEFRCDNDTAGRPGVGCVIPWYPSILYYDQSSYPDLASHVKRAQASGLPGGSFKHPLTRTTDAQTIRDNRQKACGDAPSIQGKSCDEYPIATSKQGLSSGGTRRTFSGCDLPNIPSGSGPKGASVCMITKGDNDAQGGLNTQFFRSQRVLNGDPFQIRIS
ncbi:NucA/NucB deoxyribonuclease domain-containing protein [Streptomyces sp. NPDC001492]